MSELDIKQIRSVLPHRYPFLFVDRVIEVERGKRAVALKCVTIDEPFFAGHFPEYPVMPGVLIAEALAQTAAFCVMGGDGLKDRLPLLVGLDNFRFRRQVVPGDVLRLEAELVQLRRISGRAHGRALVDGQVAAEGDILFVIGE